MRRVGAALRAVARLASDLVMRPVFWALAGGVLAAGPASAAEIRVEGDRVVVSGFFYGETDFPRLESALAQNPGIRTIRFHDMPGVRGRVGQMLALPLLIRKLRLNTEVVGFCASGCAIAFVGGVNRRTLASPSGLSFVAFHGMYHLDGRPDPTVFRPYMSTLQRFVPGLPQALLKTAYFGAQDGALVFFDPRLYRGTRSAVVLCGQGAASASRDPIACKPVKTADGRSIGLFTP
jgi:hypothetical protein